MSGDLSSLAATWSALKDTDKQAQGVVDLLTIDKQVRMNPGRYGKLFLLPVLILINTCRELTALSFWILYWQGDG